MKYFKAKCFDTSQVKFSGDINGGSSTYIEGLSFSVVKCSNKTGKLCKSPKQIEEALTNAVLTVGVP